MSARLEITLDVGRWVYNNKLEVDPSDRTTAAVVKVPAHQFALIGPRLFLNRIVKNQHTVIALHCADRSLDLFPQVLRGVFLRR